MSKHMAGVSCIAPIAAGLMGLGHVLHPAAAAGAPDPLNVLAAVCPLNPADTAGLRRVFTAGRLLEVRLDGPADKPFRAYHRILLPGGGEWVVNRVSPGGRLRRISLEWHAPAPAGPRPVLAVNASGDCRVTEGRRLIYGTDGQAETLEILSPDLAAVVLREPLNPPVPAGPTPPQGAVRVAVIDTGVNYTLPLFQGRLARDGDGALLGYDFWDMDARPFDIDAARSPFFPLHHGTAVTSIILREAPEAAILPYRYPRPDMTRFGDLVAQADTAGAVIVNMAMGSNAEADWQAFAQAAKARPHMLFIVSAGNDGRDLDKTPVFPASLGLENILTVTSADAGGRLARGSNWGASRVDVMVPGEQVAVTDHRGAAGKASGSSFAVPRVTALAARLLAKHPDWRGPELKAAILKRARKPFGGDAPLLRHGWIPDPTDDFEG
ncbi:MAG: S8 family serine peptidase [Rhodospirillales bacterium]